MRNLFPAVILTFLILILSLPAPAAAQTLTAEEVLTRLESARSAETAFMKMRMELYNTAGDQRTRQLTNRHKEGAVEKTLIEFSAPADVKGTAFLSLENRENSEEDMYLFLPVLGSVRKISGSQKNGDFVGSDLTYNDLSVFSSGNYKDNYEGQIIASSSEEYLLRLTPIDPDIEYQFGKMWIRTDIWLPTKIEFFDQAAELLKTVILKDFAEVDKNWTAREITVTNQQKGTKTVLKITEIEFNLELADQLFTTRYLER